MQGDISSSNDQKKLIEEELIGGYSSAKQLHMLLTSDHDHENNNIYNLSDHDQYGSKADHESVNSLVMKISQSFTNSIRFILSDESTCTDECNMKDYSDDDDQAQATFHDLTVSSPSLNFNHKFEDSTTMISTETNTKVHSKRRKTLVTRETTNPIPTEDGHAWRKYGQKIIQHFKYPKSYFRCTYKNDQGCEATKQVQRIAENPPMFRTTYYGYHRCKDIHYFNPHDLDDDTILSILDGTNRTSTRNHCNILSFDVKKKNNKEKQVNPSHLSTTNMEDCHKNETPLLTTSINTQTQSSPLEIDLLLTTYVPSSTIASPLLDRESEDSELFHLDDDIWDFLFK